MLKRLILFAVLLAFTAAACGEGEDAAEPNEGTAEPLPTASDPLPSSDGGDAGGTVMAPIGETMTIEELLEADDGGPYSIRGYVFVLEDGRVVISDALAESFPPQPGGAQIEVRGANLQTVPLEEPTDSELATVQWTNEPIELIGFLDGGVFNGSTPASI